MSGQFNQFDCNWIAYSWNPSRLFFSIFSAQLSHRVVILTAGINSQFYQWRSSRRAGEPRSFCPLHFYWKQRKFSFASWSQCRFHYSQRPPVFIMIRGKKLKPALLVHLSSFDQSLRSPRLSPKGEEVEYVVVDLGEKIEKRTKISSMSWYFILASISICLRNIYQSFPL